VAAARDTIAVGRRARARHFSDASKRHDLEMVWKRRQMKHWDWEEAHQVEVLQHDMEAARRRDTTSLFVNSSEEHREVQVR
jgi:hypothetical protein